MNPEEIRTVEDVIKLFEEMGTERYLSFASILTRRLIVAGL